MKIVLAGGTGFVGSSLQTALSQQGHEVVILTRQKTRETQSTPKLRFVPWDPTKNGAWAEHLKDVDACINLAGESIAAKRWTKVQKFKIIESRCDATQALVHAISKLSKKPQVLINASAVGFYGPHGDEIMTEKDGPGKDFLAQTCKAWEAHAIRAQDFGLRVVRLRFGIVLEKDGGALAKMIPPFKFFIGGPLGDGKQWMSWIHREDIIGMILWALENQQVSGPVNATASNPVTMKEFAATLGKIMGRPSFAAVPGLVLKILLGEMSDLLLTGQRVIPEKALALGYRFKYPSLETALQAILK